MVAESQIDASLGEALQENEAALSNEIAEVIAETLRHSYPAGKRPMRRDQHAKAHGVVRATFQVETALPPNLAQGAFVPGRSYQAWIRFSNGDADPTRHDSKGDARGMAIKLCGVPGAKLLADIPGAEPHTQDFLLINHPVFFLDDLKSYLSLIRRIGSTNPLVQLAAPLAVGFKGALIVKDITSARITSPLETRYWSTLPSRLGDDANKQAVKYSARPVVASATTFPIDASPGYLRDTMAQQLAQGDFRFDFLVQPRAPSMSVEVTTDEWTEAAAPFVKVATITIPKQTFTTPAQDAFGENLSFSPWHALAEHRPLGAINRCRRVVYEEISKLRHEVNGAARAEPTGDEQFS